MKKKAASAVLFAMSFIATYILLCLAFTGGKMALEATPFDYVRVAITYMAWFKIMVSLAVAILAGAIPTVMESRKR